MQVEGGHCVVDVVGFGGADDRAVTPARLAIQARATWARGTCRSAAIRATCSTIKMSTG